MICCRCRGPGVSVTCSHCGVTRYCSRACAGADAAHAGRCAAFADLERAGVVATLRDRLKQGIRASTKGPDVVEFSAPTPGAAVVLAALCRDLGADLAQARGPDVLVVVFPAILTDACRRAIELFDHAREDVRQRRRVHSDSFVMELPSEREAEETCLAYECVSPHIHARVIQPGNPSKIAVCM